MQNFDRPEDEVNDGVCVERFALAMTAKLRAARDRGRHSWDDPAGCSLADLSDLLLQHVAKGDPLDVANYAMMIHQRGGCIVVSASPIEAPYTRRDKMQVGEAR